MRDAGSTLQGMPQPTRVRAERVEVGRSRAAILAAAEAYYSSHNADPTMSELAVLAGVGNATLYRRFPTIGDVIRALYARHVELLDELGTQVFPQPTGWEGIEALVRGLAALLLEHPAIMRVTRKMVEIEPAHVHGAQWDPQLRELADRAHAEGTLRADADAYDVLFAAFRMGEYTYLPADARSRMVARQASLVLDGLRAECSRTPLGGVPIDTEEIRAYWRVPMP